MGPFGSRNLALGSFSDELAPVKLLNKGNLFYQQLETQKQRNNGPRTLTVLGEKERWCEHRLDSEDGVSTVSTRKLLAGLTRRSNEPKGWGKGFHDAIERLARRRGRISSRPRG